MKPKEFLKIKTDFQKEQKYWEALKIGDIIYEEVSRSFEFDYHKAIIKEIYIDDRYIIVEDISVTPSKTKKYSYFLTETEFKNL